LPHALMKRVKSLNREYFNLTALLAKYPVCSQQIKLSRHGLAVRANPGGDVGVPGHAAN
jgi:hypothetical protein